jgi:hypothetical protein
MLSRDEILTIFAAGPEAVVSLVEQLVATQAELRQQVRTLTARVQELETRMNKDSHNSHKPPSSDPAPGGGPTGCYSEPTAMSTRHCREVTLFV